jgi:tetratricopeptide (TPR) repeat protein
LINSNEKRAHRFLTKFVHALDENKLVWATTLLIKGLKIDRNPIKTVFKHNIGLIYLLRGRFYDALSIFKRIMKIEPDCLSIKANYLIALKCVN